LSTTTGHDHSDEATQKVFHAMEGRDPAEVELLRGAMRDQTHGESNLYQSIDDGMHKGDENEAVAMLAGDRVNSARAALANEDDPKRLHEVVSGLHPDELQQLRTEPFRSAALMKIKNPADRAEISALMDNDPTKANSEHIANLLKVKDDGMAKGADAMTDEVGRDNYDRRKPANVLKEMEAMSGEDVQAAAKAWNAAHPDQTFEQMIEKRWGDDSDKTERNRLLAMVHGNKGLDRSLRLQEGMRENDQDEIEGALGHEKTDEAALKSKDKKVREHAEAVRDENASFETNNVEADRLKQSWVNSFTGNNEAPAVGRSTAAQLESHYDADKREDIGSTTAEKYLDGDAAKQIHADRQQKHDDKNLDDRVGAMELLNDGKLSPETQVHRGKDAKAKAEVLESITSNADLAAAQKRYAAKYPGKEMLPFNGDRKDMNANELMIDNVRLYGVKSERPAQVEYLLQLQQYEKQYSSSLEMSEADEAGGGTQRWQRQELATMHDMLKDPKVQAFDHEVAKDPKTGMPFMIDNPNEPGVDQIDKMLPTAYEHVGDGLKDGVSKQAFGEIDKGMTAANKAEEGAKKRLADHIVKIFSTIAKIAAALTLQPELIALIDVGEGLIEMGVKWQVMGEAYDPAEDAKMLAFTAAADVALMGLSKVGKIKGELAIAEGAAVNAGEKTAVEMGEVASGEAKADALREGAHAAAGESTVMKGAIEEGASAEKALGSQAASSVGSEVEQKATKLAEGQALHEGETAAAKSVENDLEKGALEEGETGAKKVLSPEEIAAKLDKQWGLYGAGAKMVIQTIGGGIVQGKSPAQVLRSLVTGGIGLVLPGPLSEKVKAAIGSETAALKVLGELGSFGTEVATNTTINAAGGADAGDAALDAFIGASGRRVGDAYRARGGGGTNDEHETKQLTDGSTSTEPAATTTETTTETKTEPTAKKPEADALPLELLAAPLAAKQEPVAKPVVNDEPVAKPVVNNEPVAKPVVNDESIAKQEPTVAPVVADEPAAAPVVAQHEPAATSPTEKTAAQQEHDTLVELSRTAKTDEERAQVAEWAAELDAKDPASMLGTLRDLNIGARADGHLSQSDGSTLREWGHEGGLDQMPLLEAMHYEGMDKSEVDRVFQKAVNNDAGVSHQPTDAAVHTASDGTALAVPKSGAEGALTPDEIKMLIDVHARRFDELHVAYTPPSSGRELDGSPMRKAVTDTQAAEFAANERTDRSGNKVPTDTIGGDIGLKSNTEGQSAERASATLGLDYDHPSNKYYNPDDNHWSPMVTQDGLPTVDFNLNQGLYDNLQVPLGTDATEMFKQQGRDLTASGEYVPELLRPTTGPDGTEQFPHINTRDRQNERDPRVGWGFSATERAIDPATNLPYPVIPNQETTVAGYRPLGEYDVGKLAPETAANISGDAQTAIFAAPAAAEPINETPALAAKVDEKPEMATVVAAVPELGPEIGAQDSAVGKVADQVAALPKLDKATPTPVAPASEASMSPEDAFARAKASNKSKTADPTISGDVAGFIAAADNARVGANPELQAQRAQFERTVSMSPEAHAAVQETLDTMSRKALDYIERMHGGDVEEILGLLGRDPTLRKYVGAVGEDAQTIRTVLESGNVRERMVALSEFQDKILGPDAIKDGGIEAMTSAFADGNSAFANADIARLAARRDEYLKTLPADVEPTGKGFFGPLGGDEGPHADYAAAKKQDMDTKFPPVAADDASKALGTTQSEQTKSGEGSPFAKTTMTVDEAQARGMNLSPREIAMANPDGTLPWVVGERANMVDPNAPFIQNANASSMPLKAGISGTTFRAMGMFEALGADPQMARLACMDQLNAIDAHSFHEIAEASQGFFPTDSPNRYDQNTPYTPGAMGLDRATLEAIAKRQGLDLDDLNNMGESQSSNQFEDKHDQ
jgi:hypothetical protein